VVTELDDGADFYRDFFRSIDAAAAGDSFAVTASPSAKNVLRVAVQVPILHTSDDFATTTLAFL
jgi:hypothetical protein